MKFEWLRIIDKVGEYLKNDITKVVFGTIAARLTYILFLPIISRLYSPSDFGILAAFIANVSVISVAACLRFDISLPFAEEEHASTLFTLSIISVTIVSVLLFIIGISLSESLSNLMAFKKIQGYIWLVPIGILAVGLYNTFLNWATRTRQFSQIAYSRIQQSLLGSFSQIALGWFGVVPLGLLIGYIITSSASIMRLSRNSPANQFIRMLCSPKELASVFVRYKTYPLFSVPESMINLAGVQIPIIIIAAHSESEAGSFFLAMLIINTPISLFGTAISQVYSAKIKTEIEHGRVSAYTLSIIGRLMLLGLPAILAISLIAPVIFPYIFGAEWIRSGYLIVMMAPWMYLQLIISPVSPVLYATGMQKEMLIMTIIGLIQRVGAILISIEYDLTSPVNAFIIGSVMYYLTVFGFVVVSAKIQTSELLKEISGLLNKWLLLTYITIYIMSKAIYG